MVSPHTSSIIFTTLCVSCSTSSQSSGVGRMCTFTACKSSKLFPCTGCGGGKGEGRLVGFRDHWIYLCVTSKLYKRDTGQLLTWAGVHIRTQLYQSGLTIVQRAEQADSLGMAEARVRYSIWKPLRQNVWLTFDLWWKISQFYMLC